MHARGLDAVDGADGARQLAFQRAQVVDVLHEAGGAERVALVENLVTNAAALGQAGFGKLHAQPRDQLLGHHDDGAVVAHLIRDALALQVLDDGGGVLEAEIGEKRGHLRRGDPQDHESEKSHKGNGDRAHGRDTRGTERSDELDESLHEGSCLGIGSAICATRQELPGAWLPAG